MRTSRTRSRGQSMVEFALTIGLLMIVVLFGVQLGVILYYRSTLQFATHEGVFNGSLTGHGPADATATTQSVWAALGDGHPAQITVTTHGGLITDSAQADAPAFLPVPHHLSVSSTHTIEAFQPGS